MDQGREDGFMDEDRMVNEGLGGGNVTPGNGYIGETQTDTMDDPESVIDSVESRAIEEEAREDANW